MDKYESSLKVYRDLYSVIDSAFIEGRSEGKIEGLEEGRQAGLQEGKYNMAKLLKDNGVQIELIIQTTDLTREEIELL
jgi:predicted transposase/invertase (TIGR01784 family)